MSNRLLHLVSMPLDPKVQNRMKGGDIPLALPFSVNPETAPYLVSGAKQPTVWVPQSPKGKIHAAIRDAEGFDKEVLDAVTSMGLQLEWGNVHPLTVEGIQACVKHLADFDFENIELLVRDDLEVELPEDLQDKVVLAEWLPEKCVVVVPKDRSYLGWIGTVLPGKIVSVVHNASRAMAVARGE